MGQIKPLDRTVQKTHEWVHTVQKELGWTDERRAYTALRAVLHALRDRLTLQELAQFGAQLPTFVRGMYYEGWNPNRIPLHKRDAESFLGQIQAAFDRTNQPLVDTADVAATVFCVIENLMSPGEIEQVKGLLPARIRRFWPERKLASRKPEKARPPRAA
jgi:uncharacterized protein (DUF2267 family)